MIRMLYLRLREMLDKEENLTQGQFLSQITEATAIPMATWMALLAVALDQMVEMLMIPQSTWAAFRTRFTPLPPAQRQRILSVLQQDAEQNLNFRKIEFQSHEKSLEQDEQGLAQRLTAIQARIQQTNDPEIRDFLEQARMRIQTQHAETKESLRRTQEVLKGI